MTDSAAAALTGDNGSADPGAAPTTNAGAGDSAPWYGEVSEDQAAFIENKGWKSPVDAVTSYQNLEKFAGGSKNLVALPGDDATDEDISSFYAKLGRPDAPENYSLQMPDGGDENLFEWFRGTAHANGLTDKQASEMFNAYQEMAEGRMTEMQDNLRAQGEQAIKDLKKEWGNAYDSQLNAGKKAVAALGYEEQELTAMEEKLGTADMLKLFAKIGDRMGEDSFEDGNSTGDTFGGMTPAAAQAELSNLRLDKGFMDRYLGGDKDAVAKYTRLMKSAHPGA